MSASPCAAPPAPSIPDSMGRHRQNPTSRARLARIVDVVGRLGSLVALAALLVVAGAVGGLLDGTPAGATPTVTATFSGTGH